MGYVRVRGIVDIGTIYSVIPKSVAEKLQLKEVDRRRFKTASGEVVEYPVSEAYISIEGKGATSRVAIANEKTPTLLGGNNAGIAGLAS